MVYYGKEELEKLIEVFKESYLMIVKNIDVLGNEVELGLVIEELISRASEKWFDKDFEFYDADRLIAEMKESLETIEEDESIKIFEKAKKELINRIKEK